MSNPNINISKPAQPVCKPVAQPVQDRRLRSPRERGPARTTDIVLSPEAPGYDEWLRRRNPR